MTLRLEGKEMLLERGEASMARAQCVPWRLSWNVRSFRRVFDRPRALLLFFSCEKIGTIFSQCIESLSNSGTRDPRLHLFALHLTMTRLTMVP